MVTIQQGRTGETGLGTGKILNFFHKPNKIPRERKQMAINQEPKLCAYRSRTEELDWGDACLIIALGSTLALMAFVVEKLHY